MKPVETKRLIIRNFVEKDAAGLFEYLKSPSVSCFFDLKLGSMEDAVKEVVKRAQDDQYVAVCLKDSDTLIGDMFCMFEKPDTYSVGWNYNGAYGGMGYAYEAAQAMFKHLFLKNEARRLYAYVEEDNLPSQRLCEKLGMRKEGVFKEYVSFGKDSNGVSLYENTMQFALLKKEWQASGAPENLSI